MRSLALLLFSLCLSFSSLEGAKSARILNPMPGYISIYYQLIDKNDVISFQKMANTGWNQLGVSEVNPRGQYYKINTGKYFFIYWADEPGESRFDVYMVEIERGDPRSGRKDQLDFDKLGSYTVPNALDFHFSEPLPAGWKKFENGGAYLTVKGDGGVRLRIVAIYHKYKNSPTFDPTN